MIDIEPLSFISGFSVAVVLFFAYTLEDFLYRNKDEE